MNISYISKRKTFVYIEEDAQGEAVHNVSSESSDSDESQDNFESDIQQLDDEQADILRRLSQSQSMSMPNTSQMMQHNSITSPNRMSGQNKFINTSPNAHRSQSNAELDTQMFMGTKVTNMPGRQSMGESTWRPGGVGKSVEFVTAQASDPIQEENVVAYNNSMDSINQSPPKPTHESINHLKNETEKDCNESYDRPAGPEI